VGTSFILGLSVALLLNKNIKGKFIYRSLLIIPMVLPPIVIGFTFRFMYNYDFGVLNYFLDIIGLSRVTFLASTKTALPSIVIADIWQWTPFMILVFLSALEVIPEELYEAAKIDGASKQKIFVYITLPLMKPVVVIALLIRIMDSFRAFDKIFIMTRGGPGESSQTLSLYIWKKGLSFFQISEAIAMSIILLIIILLLSKLFIRYMQKDEQL
jgi:multiple sugar transport system permease protein